MKSKWDDESRNLEMKDPAGSTRRFRDEQKGSRLFAGVEDFDSYPIK